MPHIYKNKDPVNLLCKTLDRDNLSWLWPVESKMGLQEEYADLIYLGLRFSGWVPPKQCLRADLILFDNYMKVSWCVPTAKPTKDRIQVERNERSTGHGFLIPCVGHVSAIQRVDMMGPTMDLQWSILSQIGRSQISILLLIFGCWFLLSVSL